MIGAPGDDSNVHGALAGLEQGTDFSDSGAVYIYQYNNGWELKSFLKASNAAQGDEFGSSVSLSSETLVVGATKKDVPNSQGATNSQGGENSGAVYVYDFEDSSLVPKAYLTAPAPAENLLFGRSLSVNQDTIVVGQSPQVGGAIIFTHSNDDWSKLERFDLTSDSPIGERGFGSQVAAGRDMVAILSEDAYVSGQDERGAVFIYERSMNNWKQAFVVFENVSDLAHYASSMSFSGDALAVSAPGESKVYLYSRSTSGWIKSVDVGPMFPRFDNEERFGHSLALSRSTLAVGVPYDNSASTGINPDGLGSDNADTFKDLILTGAVTVFSDF